MGKPLGFSGFASGTVSGVPLQVLAENTTGGVQKTYFETMAVETFTAQDATPSVASRASVYKTANASATTITAFDGGVAGQRFVLVIGDANTTIDFSSTTLKGNAGVDKTCAATDSLHCAYDGTNWHCAVVDGTT